MGALKEFDEFEREHEDLKSERLAVENTWRDVGNYVATSDDMGPIERGGGQLPRNRVDVTARINVQRLGAVLNGYLFNPFSPFFKARLADGKANQEQSRWMAEVDRIMHARLTGPRAPFRLAMGLSLYHAAAYGNAPMWIANKGKRFVSIAVPVWDAWSAEDPETQLVDTMHRRFRLSAWRAALRYPDNQDLQTIASKTPNLTQTFIQAIGPNAGGVSGSRKLAKPYRETTVWMEGKQVVGHDGYDDFPGASMRFYRRSNSAYGYGPGTEILPAAKLINAREDNAVQAEEQNINPTLLDYTNGAVDAHDRRPGARIPVDGAQFGMMRNGRPMERLFDQIDLRDSHIRVAALRDQIAQACYVDWLSPGEGAHVTATFVNDKRDLRMRAMATVVSGMEYDFNQIGDRYFNLFQRAGLIPPPPDSLRGAEIVFDFVSPLALAQERGQVEQLMGWLSVAAQAVAFDPSAGRVVDAPEVVRDAARRFNVPEPVIRSAAALAEEAAREQDQAERAEDAELSQTAATVLRDAGQGAAALAGAGGALR